MNLPESINWKKDKKLTSLIKTIDKVKILSLDIYDTLLFRTVAKSSDIFILLGKRAIEQEIVKSSFHPREIKNIRLLAENVARSNNKQKNNTSEVSLDQIYNYIPNFIGDVQALKELELQIECEMSYLNPNILSLLFDCKNKGIKIVLVSNMYLSTRQIEYILIANNFNIDIVDSIYVSSDYKVSKVDGSLFEVVLRDFKVHSLEKIIHIGDNKVADIQGANNVGIKSIHYNVIANNDSEDIFTWEEIKYNKPLVPELTSLRKLTYHNNNEQFKEDYFYSWGSAVLGPILTIFSEWVVDICIKENIKGIFPIMREGALFSKLLEKAINNRNLNIFVKPLFLSRQAVFLPSLISLDNEAIENIFDRRRLTVKDLLNFLKLPHYLDEFEKYKNIYLDEAHTVFVGKVNLKENIRKWLLTNKIQSEMNIIIKKEKELLIKYIAQTLRGFENVVTIDLGFEGTIQKALHSLVESKDINKKFLHLLVFGGEKNKQHLLDGMDIRGFAGNSGENIKIIKKIIRSSEMIEQLISDDCGCTKGYEENSQVIKPILDNVSINASIKESCQKGILFFQDLWFFINSQKPYLRTELYENKIEFSSMIERLISMPTREEVGKLGRMYYDENFGSTYIDKIITEDDKRLLKKEGIQRFLDFTTNGYRMGKVNWPEGVVTEQFPHYFFSLYLSQSESGTYFSKMLKIINSINQTGIRNIVIYGAGEAGVSLLQVANLFNIKVEAFVDRNQKLWGTYLEGVKVVSLEEVVKGNSHVYAVGSFSFIDQIKNSIIRKYNNSNVQPKIFFYSNN
ncbi:HAD family hydrolase [Niallia circulans]|uniref:HAD family hydrolase n=1 Tax=Niallia circulans TaxID=1397 RepID=UPI00352683CE